MKNRNNGSRIFLTELMFAILFFIIVSAICVQCFATAFAKSVDAKELTHAVNIATNLAEEYLASDDFDGRTEYYDKDFNQVSSISEYSATAIVIEPEKKTDCEKLHIVVTNSKDEEIYSLMVEKALK